MASWELGQGQIPSLGERVEHRGLLYHDCAPYHHHGGDDDDDDCKDDYCVDVGTTNNNNAIYEAVDKDKWDRNNGHVKGMVAHLVSEDNGWISSQLQSIICIEYIHAIQIENKRKYKYEHKYKYKYKQFISLDDNGWISSQLQSIICIGYMLRNTDTHTQIQIQQQTQTNHLISLQL